ncbi:hypothetical protein [Nereida sp. MMG025]|uniref:hypothetical protein n=1 Tax=Nereida sp. MMG025 TaxID=2909981 RepID=UPI001F3F2205|nr:hypothetical protein [Nereida sp. MMG025]MCF6445076.1 hypothetical protein [Nereida sp. MMG025]
MSERPSAPNFTNAFICMAGVLLFCALVTVFVFYGILGAAAFAYLTDRLVIQKVPEKIRKRA